MTFSADAPDWGLPARVVFQPLVDLHAWKVVGFEALARFEGIPSPLEAFESDFFADEHAVRATLASAAVMTLRRVGM